MYGLDGRGGAGEGPQLAIRPRTEFEQRRGRGGEEKFLDGLDVGRADSHTQPNPHGEVNRRVRTRQDGHASGDSADVTGELGLERRRALSRTRLRDSHHRPPIAVLSPW